MTRAPRPVPSTASGSTSYGYARSTSRTVTGYRSTERSRPGTRASTAGGPNSQHIVCAVSESRGISPTVGLAFVNISTGEAVLSQICDTQTYVRTIHKLAVYDPSEVLIANTAFNPKSKMLSFIEENVPDIDVIPLDRKYYAETTGLEYIQQLAFVEDVEAIKIAIGGNYFATCCLAAVLKYIELNLHVSFAFHTLRIKYRPSEGSMMIDPSTICSLELIQNLQNPRSTDCLFGLLNQTLTPMGSRLLRSSILQPLTETDTLEARLDALEEITTKEEMFFATRQALKPFLDMDRLLTALITVPTKASLQLSEQSINNIIILKQAVNCIGPVHEALAGARSALLISIRELCAPEKLDAIQELIGQVINPDITYQKSPLDLRNQRCYAVKSGVNGLLDVARQTYKEATADVYQLVSDLGTEHDLAINLKFESSRGFYLRLIASDVEDRPFPPVFVNIIRKKNTIECNTLELMKRNAKIEDCLTEILLMSDKTIQELVENVRSEVSVLFRICEGVAMLDMIASFGQLVTTQDYVRPQYTDTLAIKAGRHPIRERIHTERFVPNDVYATQQTRFQVITGCNMSGKSTYIRSTALMAVMAQIGSFVPAQYASFPVFQQLFARITMDDNIEANISTFASEMRETAFILRNIEKGGLVIIDELGRGTSTRDGLAIALSVAEAFVESRALVWFATHFRDLAHIMAERNGVVNLHLDVEMTEANTMTMLYKIRDGSVTEEHYGLALARLVPFPPKVLEVATDVSEKLTKQIARRKKGSSAFALARRRKLILNLKETLIQTRDGPMEGKVLTSWLRRLQEEFVVRMSAIDREAADESDNDENGDERNSQEMENEDEEDTEDGIFVADHSADKEIEEDEDGDEATTDEDD